MRRGLPPGAKEPVLSTCPDCGHSSRVSLPHSQATCSWASSSPRPSGSFWGTGGRSWPIRARAHQTRSGVWNGAPTVRGPRDYPLAEDAC